MGEIAFLLWSPTVGLGCWRVNCRHCIQRNPSDSPPSELPSAKHFAGVIYVKVGVSLGVLCTVNHGSQRIWGIGPVWNPSRSRVKVGCTIEAICGEFPNSDMQSRTIPMVQDVSVKRYLLWNTPYPVHWQPLLCAG